MPASIADAPEARDDLRFFLDAYIELSTERQASINGASPIPRHRIVAYAREHGYPDVDDFRAIIMGLDASLLVELSKKEKQ